MSELVDSLRKDNNDDPLAGMQDICRHAIRSLAENECHRRIYTILFSRCEFVSSLNPAVELQNQLGQESLAMITEDLERARELGHLKEGVQPRVAAVALFSQMNGIYLAWLRNPALFDLQREGEAILDLFFTGLRRKPA